MLGRFDQRWATGQVRNQHDLDIDGLKTGFGRPVQIQTQDEGGEQLRQPQLSMENHGIHVVHRFLTDPPEGVDPLLTTSLSRSRRITWHRGGDILSSHIIRDRRPSAEWVPLPETGTLLTSH